MGWIDNLCGKFGQRFRKIDFLLVHLPIFPSSHPHLTFESFTLVTFLDNCYTYFLKYQRLTNILWWNQCFIMYLTLILLVTRKNIFNLTSSNVAWIILVLWIRWEMPCIFTWILLKWTKPMLLSKFFLLFLFPFLLYWTYCLVYIDQKLFIWWTCSSIHGICFKIFSCHYTANLGNYSKFTMLAWHYII